MKTTPHNKRKFHRLVIALLALTLVFASAGTASAKSRHYYDPGDLTVEEGVVQVDNYEVPYIETGTQKYWRGKTVLFLHGIAFDRYDWDEKGILEDVAAAGNRAIAVNLPRAGFAPPADVDPGVFLKDTIDALDINPRKLVVVAPSYSGFYALDMVNDHPNMKLAGLVGVAPKDVENFEALSKQQARKTPTLITWATEDNRIPTNDPELGAEALKAKINKSKVKLYESTSHSFYFTTPELTQEFTSDLILFTKYPKLSLKWVF